MHDLPGTNKSLGQHWLKDVTYLERIASLGGFTENSTVVEVGPGPGGLTELLVKRAKRVIAVEFDEALAADLPIRVSANNLEVIQQDILTYDFSSISGEYHVVANIPYYLTAKLVRNMLTAVNQPRTITLLIQKEVAERLAAKPGDMSILGVSAQLYAEVSLFDIVPPAAFIPPPKVDSQIVCMTVRQLPLFGDINPSDLLRLVKFGFSEKRKKLVNTLSGGLQIEKHTLEEIISSLAWGPNVRAQELSLQQWHDLYVHLHKNRMV